MKHSVTELITPQSEKVVVPDIIHFVWIGTFTKITIDYIKIWKEANTDKKIYIWCDEHATLSLLFHNALRDYVLSSGTENNLDDEVSLKNDAFNYMYPKLKTGCFFDDLVVEFLSVHNIPCSFSNPPELISSFENHGIVVKNIRELFCGEFSGFMKYYYYEIILRCNIASASDIVRLLIIYNYGGIYIDVDTLPYTDNLFRRSSYFLETERIVNDDFLLLYKTKCILKKLLAIDFDDGEYLRYYSDDSGLVPDKYIKIKNLIDLDMTEFSLASISPLGKMYVHKNLLSIGAVRRHKGILFNNFIASHINSKTIKIILRTMKKRYIFLEKNNCIFDIYKLNKKECYLTRILTWRTELITRNYCVTSVLTGPGLIFEVLIGLAYELLDLGNLTEPSHVAEYLQNEMFGFALFQHNLDTPEGVCSVWRK